MKNIISTLFILGGIAVGIWLLNTDFGDNSQTWNTKELDFAKNQNLVADRQAAKAIAEAAWLEKGRAPEIPASVIAWDLGAGESSVIATALQLPGAYAVIDDLSGRKCGLALGIGVIGTLGVIVAAHRRGALTDPRAVLLELRSAGMWLSDAVIARTLRIAGIES